MHVYKVNSKKCFNLVHFLVFFWCCSCPYFCLWFCFFACFVTVITWRIGFYHHVTYRFLFFVPAVCSLRSFPMNDILLSVISFLRSLWLSTICRFFQTQYISSAIPVVVLSRITLRATSLFFSTAMIWKNDINTTQKEKLFLINNTGTSCCN